MADTYDHEATGLALISYIELTSSIVSPFSLTSTRLSGQAFFSMGSFSLAVVWHTYDPIDMGRLKIGSHFDALGRYIS
jgi:hypothetical protein